MTKWPLRAQRQPGATTSGRCYRGYPEQDGVLEPKHVGDHEDPEEAVERAEERCGADDCDHGDDEPAEGPLHTTDRAATLYR